MRSGYLGFDLGDHMGWAELNEHRRGYDIAFGHWELKPSGHESASMRYVRFEKHLRVALRGIYLVFYELARFHRGVQAAHVHGGYKMKLIEVCEDMGVHVKHVEVGQVKKSATGKGNASKDMMVAAARAAGYPVETDDEADAIFIVRHGWETL